ncbi:MAG: hypothetical protein AB1486_14595 [Planctomycetota bacterium]
MADAFSSDGLSPYLRQEGTILLVDQGNTADQRTVNGFLWVFFALPLVVLLLDRYLFVVALLIFAIPGLLLFFLHTLETWPRSLDQAGKKMVIRRPLLPVTRDLATVHEVTLHDEFRYTGKYRRQYAVRVLRAHLTGARKSIPLVVMRAEEISPERFLALAATICAFMGWEMPAPPVSP